MGPVLKTALLGILLVVGLSVSASAYTFGEKNARGQCWNGYGWVTCWSIAKHPGDNPVGAKEIPKTGDATSSNRASTATCATMNKWKKHNRRATRRECEDFK